VVDMQNFNKVTVNSSKGTAVIEPGNRLGDVATALANSGRAMPHGTCAYVGIGGHACKDHPCRHILSLSHIL
jgi:FAD/FMN-containing dehydrogenase